jgi:hypothetical protein
MSIPEIFACEEAAIRALDQLFPELEAVPCEVRGNGLQVVGVFQKFSGKRRSTERREPDREAVFSFCLDLLPGKCEHEFASVVGIQVGLAGEHFGSDDDRRQFWDLASHRPDLWKIVRG